jgi:hypothetical protein
MAGHARPCSFLYAAHPAARCPGMELFESAER